MSQTSDAQILDGCLRGEKRAWDAFVDRYSRLVYWSIWKALGGSSAPNKQEICRETFQEFFRRMLETPRMEKLSRAANVRKYLQVTASHLVFERFRRAGQTESAEMPAGQVSDPGEEAVLAERRAILESVLGALKPKERSCLELHYLDGHTHREIGVMLDLPQDTVSTILRRTKEKVKERLRRRGVEES